MEWILAQQHGLTLLQIGLDLFLILFLAILFSKRLRRDRSLEELTESFGKIVEDTQRIAGEFEANLRERQQLIQQLLVKLDERLDQARQMNRRLEVSQNQGHLSSRKPSPAPRPFENDEILRLARQGMDAASIARQMQKPLGEVELVLKLQNISGKR
ncbi:MAG: hypothetical protein KBH99_11190 [Syntrophobacteraceae bacterium]|nr:hypothetical protein [Syntrophobacteraceae bacterium]